MAIVDVEIPTGYVYTGYRFLDEFVRYSRNNTSLGHASVRDDKILACNTACVQMQYCAKLLASQVVDWQGGAKIVDSLLCSPRILWCY